MRTRYKILLLLLAATLALGAVVYMQSRQDETPLARFRWLVFHHPMRNMSDAVTSLTESNSENSKATILGYGALSLLAVIMVGIALKSVSNAQLRTFKDRLVETQVAKAESEALLQDAMWKEKNARAGREAALKELDASSSRILALEDQLSGTERLLKKREAELKALQSRQAAASEQPLQKPLPSTPDQRMLKEELRKTTELLKSKESALAELKQDFAERIDTLTGQLKLSEKLRQEHHSKLEALRAEIVEAQAAKHEAESLRAEQSNKYKQALAAKDAALKELEQEFTAKIHALETQGSGHQELLQSRGTELEGLRSEMNVLTAQLANVVAAKEHAESLLQQELEQKAELLQSKDSTFKEVQERSKASIQALEARLADQERLQKKREQELAALKRQLTEAGAVKNRAEASLTEELRKEKQALAAKDAAMKELERNLLAKIDSLNLQLRETQELWQSRGAELEAFRSEINVLTARLADMASAKERVETLLQQELKNRAEVLQSKDSGWKEAQTKLTARVHDLESQLTEQDALLAQRNVELDALGSQLTNLQSSSKHREELLRQELKQMTDILQAKDLATRELEDSLAKIAAAEKKEISERERLLNNRDKELESLRSEVHALNAQLQQINQATARPEELLEDQTANEALHKKLEESSKKILALEGALREKEDLLKTHDGKIERLETELKEKRTELAKHEISVWQAYERRALWKQRLGKFGISIKD
ncbi:MAG: hypothetical protein ACM37Z_06815 [Deltaproteobacteria bacterium]